MTFSKEMLEALAKNPVPVLNRGYRAQERIEARQARIASWRKIAESITVNPESSGGGGSGFTENKLERCVLNIVELQDELRGEINTLLGYELETGRILRQLVEDVNLRTILEHRYLEYKHWELIACEMGYTFRWTQELHKRALSALKKAAAAELEKVKESA